MVQLYWERIQLVLPMAIAICGNLKSDDSLKGVFRLDPRRGSLGIHLEELCFSYFLTIIQHDHVRLLQTFQA
jgi:hypothetical protein